MSHVTPGHEEEPIAADAVVSNDSELNRAATPKGGIGTWMKNFGTKFRQTFWATSREKRAMVPCERSGLMSRRKFLGKSGAAFGTAAAAYYLGKKNGGAPTAPESTTEPTKKGLAFRETELGREPLPAEKMEGMPAIYKDHPEIWQGFSSTQRDNIRAGNEQLLNDGVVDQQGHVIEKKSMDKGSRKPGEVEETLQNLNSIWKAAPVPAIEAVGWLANHFWSSAVQSKKIMRTSRTMIDEDEEDGIDHPTISAKTPYEDITPKHHSLDQLTALHDEIVATQGQVNRLMRQVDSRESAARVLAQVSYLAWEVFQMGFSITGILSVRGGHNALGVGAAYLVHKLRTAVRGDATKEMAEEALRDLAVHLSRIEKAIEAIKKSREGGKSAQEREQAAREKQEEGTRAAQLREEEHQRALDRLQRESELRREEEAARAQREARNKLILPPDTGAGPKAP